MWLSNGSKTTTAAHMSSIKSSKLRLIWCLAKLCGYSPSLLKYKISFKVLLLSVEQNPTRHVCKSSKHNRTNAGKTGSHSLNVCETFFPGGKRRLEGYKNRSVPGALNKSCKQGWGLETAAEWELENARLLQYVCESSDFFPSNNWKMFCEQLCQDLTNPESTC